MLRRRYRLSPRARLAAHGGHDFLLCDHPLQALRLNATAAAVLRGLDGRAFLDDLVEAPAPGLWSYLDGLVGRGLLETAHALTPPHPWPPVHIIVPAYRAAAPLARCLAALEALDYPRERLRVTVVDDASPLPLEPEVRALWGGEGAALSVTWLRLTANRGPGEARNAAALAPELGLTAGEEPVLAFTDADCVPAPGWLRELVPLLESPGPAAVGGQVTGLRTDGWLARYEHRCSSLNMGDRPGPVAAERAPVPYLPSCNLVVRAGVFRAVGGFRAGWRTGEDVDLCWRLAGAGHGLYYWPPGRVAHDHRTRPGAFWRTRRAYARSEPRLARAHPGRLTPPRQAPALGAALWLATAAGAAGLWWPALLALALALLPSVWAVQRVLARWPAELPRPVRRAWGAALARRSGGGLLEQARSLCRRWWVLWWLPAALAPWWGLPAGLVWLGGGLGTWRARRPQLAFPVFLLAYGLDSLAYSAGRIEGWLRAWGAPGGGSSDPGSHTGESARH